MTGLYALLPLGRGLRLKQLLKHPMGRLMLSGAALLAAVCCVVLLFEQDSSAFASHGLPAGAAGDQHDAFAGLRTTVSPGGLTVGADATLNPNLYYYVDSQQSLVEERTKYKLKLLHFLGKLHGKRRHRSKQLAGLFGSLHREARHFTDAGDWAHLESWVDARAHTILGYDWLGYNSAKQEALSSMGYAAFQLKESDELSVLHRYRGEARVTGADAEELSALLANVDPLLEARATRERFRLVPEDDKLNAPRASYPAPACLADGRCPEAGAVEVDSGEQPVSGQVSWVLPSFSRLPSNKDSFVFSAPFLIGGYSWQLVLSHNASDPEGSSWWGQYLYCRDTVTWPKDVHYSIATISQLPERLSSRIDHHEVLPAGEQSMWGREYALHVRQLANPTLGFVSKGDMLRVLAHISVMPHGPQTDEGGDSSASPLAKVVSWLQSGASLVLWQVTQLHVAFWLCFKPLVEYLSRDIMPQGRSLVSSAAVRLGDLLASPLEHLRKSWLGRLPPLGLLSSAGALLWGITTAIVCAAFGWVWLAGDRWHRPPLRVEHVASHKSAAQQPRQQAGLQGGGRTSDGLQGRKGGKKGGKGSRGAPALGAAAAAAAGLARVSSPGSEDNSAISVGGGTAPPAKRFADAVAELISASTKARQKDEPRVLPEVVPLAASAIGGEGKAKASKSKASKAASEGGGNAAKTAKLSQSTAPHPGSGKGAAVDVGMDGWKACDRARKRSTRSKSAASKLSAAAVAGKGPTLAAPAAAATAAVLRVSTVRAQGSPGSNPATTGWFFQRQPQHQQAPAQPPPPPREPRPTAQDVQVAPPVKPGRPGARHVAGAPAPPAPPPLTTVRTGSAHSSGSGASLYSSSQAPVSYKAALSGAPAADASDGHKGTQQQQQHQHQLHDAGASIEAAAAVAGDDVNDHFRPFQLFGSRPPSHQTTVHPQTRDSHGSYFFSGLLGSFGMTAGSEHESVPPMVPTPPSPSPMPSPQLHRPYQQHEPAHTYQPYQQEQRSHVHQDAYYQQQQQQQSPPAQLSSARDTGIPDLPQYIPGAVGLSSPWQLQEPSLSPAPYPAAPVLFGTAATALPFATPPAQHPHQHFGGLGVQAIPPSSLNPNAQPFTPVVSAAGGGGMARYPSGDADLGFVGFVGAQGSGGIPALGHAPGQVEYVSGDAYYDAVFDVASNTWSRMSDESLEYDPPASVTSTAAAVVGDDDGADVMANSGMGVGAAGHDVGQCVFCFDAPKATTLAPCGHRALCADCTKQLLRMRGEGEGRPNCPICRNEVESYIIRVFNV